MSDGKFACIGDGLLDDGRVTGILAIGPHAADAISSFKPLDIEAFFTQCFEGRQAGWAYN